MTIHAENCNPGSISFHFVNCYSQRGDHSIRTPSPSDAPEGRGWDFFSIKEEGYGMTLHAKNGKPGCISFRFIKFYSQRGDHPP